MNADDPRSERITQLQRESWSRGDATGWFERLYAEAAGDQARIPWADKGVNPQLREWCEREGVVGAGRTACVIGCGLGADAEYLAGLGFAVTAFDISPTAVAWCQKEYPGSPVRYEVQDLFEARGRFDFVLESHTLQALPRDLRTRAVAAVAGLVDGDLLVIARGADAPEPGETIPWPLTPAELAGFDAAGLTCVRFEDFRDGKTPPQRRFRILYRRPA